MFSGFPLWLIFVSIAFSVGLCVHVVRSGRDTFWLWIILMFQPLGGMVYIAAIILPEIFGGSTSRKLQAQAREALDPTREYREARQACEDAPTVRNQSRLAIAAASLGKHQEAADLYAQAAQGIHAEDPTLLQGWANALVELGRAPEAEPLITRLQADERTGHTPNATLTRARVLDGLGRTAEAEAAYRDAAERLPGLEAWGRYAAFLARSGRKAEAKAIIEDMDRRIAKTHRQFQKEGRAWRDLASQAL